VSCFFSSLQQSADALFWLLSGVVLLETEAAPRLSLHLLSTKGVEPLYDPVHVGIDMHASGLDQQMHSPTGGSLSRLQAGSMRHPSSKGPEPVALTMGQQNKKHVRWADQPRIQPNLMHSVSVSSAKALWNRRAAAIMF